MDKVGKIFYDVEMELARARTMHPAPHHSAHESAAVLREEFEEFWDEVKKKPAKRSKEQMRAELVQVAAMAVRAIHDLEL